MTVTVELSQELEQAITEKLRNGEFRTADDLVEQAVRRFIDQEAEIAHTETLLQQAADSGDYLELTDDEWLKIEREAMKEAEERKTKR